MYGRAWHDKHDLYLRHWLQLILVASGEVLDKEPLLNWKHAMKSFLAI